MHAIRDQREGVRPQAEGQLRDDKSEIERRAYGEGQAEILRGMTVVMRMMAVSVFVIYFGLLPRLSKFCVAVVSDFFWRGGICGLHSLPIC